VPAAGGAATERRIDRSDPVMTIALLLAGGLVAIVTGCELFTNAVEWLGFRLKLGSGATGSLLAAIGTALPETIVPVIALIKATPESNDIAVGAVLGSSFLLLTLGVAVTGAAALTRRRARELVIEPEQSRRDLGFFIGAFAAAVAGVALPRVLRPVLGVALLVTYAAYVRLTLRGGVPDETMPEPLHLVRRRREPHLVLVLAQLAIAVGLLILGSTFFVDGLTRVATNLHINALVLAVIAVPAATELPETLNSFLWVRSGDDGLAFGNVAGAAVFQACLLGFLGITFTPWNPGLSGLLSAACALAAAIYLVVLLHDGRAHGRWLLLAGLPWVGYVAVEMVASGHLG